MKHTLHQPNQSVFFAQSKAACCLLWMFLLVPFSIGNFCFAQGKSQVVPSKAEVEEKKSDLKELRDQIESLRKSMSEAEDKRSDALGQLKNVERDISNTQRDLRNLSTQRLKMQQTLKNLAAQSKNLEQTLQIQRAQLESLIYRQYIQGNPDHLRIFLSGGNSNQLTRDLYYLSMIGKARSTLQSDIEVALRKRKTLESDTKERAKELAEIENAQKEKHDSFMAQRKQRKDVLQKVSAQIVQQRKEIGNLQKNEKQLSNLIDRLSKIIAARPIKRPARPVPAPTPTPGGKLAETYQVDNDKTPEAVPSGNFSRLKGALRLPVKGSVSNKFGASRQEGGAWKGLFIKASQGSEIKSIANGQVVFADWMRGFGNLLIVDHGGSYLSIYGNNESLLKQPGDTVQAGDVIAVTGNSGGNPESGLYFELRYQGQPIDPMAWVKIK